jgi:hypothetical protein
LRLRGGCERDNCVASLSATIVVGSGDVVSGGVAGCEGKLGKGEFGGWFSSSSVCSTGGDGGSAISSGAAIVATAMQQC